MPVRKRQIAALGCLLWLVAGCGGGGGGTQEVRPRLTLRWATRSRLTDAPSSALSAKVTIQPVGGAAQTVAVDRRTDPAGYSEAVDGPTAIAPGEADVRVEFFARSGAAGDLVAEAAGRVTIASDGAIPDIATVGKVAQVTVGAGQVVTVGQASELSFTARTSGGALLALTPGAAFWSVAIGTDRLSAQGAQVTGQLPGAASVRVRVDGIESAATPVRITSNVSIALNPSSAEVPVGESKAFSANVDNPHGGSRSVTWSVAESGGGTIHATTGLYQAPATPGVYHVLATSVYDPEKTATATVTVVAGSVTVGVDFPGSGDVGVTID